MTDPVKTAEGVVLQRYAAPARMIDGQLSQHAVDVRVKDKIILVRCIRQPPRGAHVKIKRLELAKGETQHTWAIVG